MDSIDKAMGDLFMQMLVDRKARQEAEVAKMAATLIGVLTPSLGPPISDDDANALADRYELILKAAKEN